MHLFVLELTIAILFL